MVSERGTVDQRPFRRLDGTKTTAGAITERGKQTHRLAPRRIHLRCASLSFLGQRTSKRKAACVSCVSQLPCIACAPGQFAARPIEMRAALAVITDASEVLSRLLAGSHSTVAGRLARAFRNIGRDQIADNIIASMRAAGFTVNEIDPFKDIPAIAFPARETSPYVNRLRMMWETMRGSIVQVFPAPPGTKADAPTYLKQVDAIYVTDAYHSLSIEGYRVNTELIERVRAGTSEPR